LQKTLWLVFSIGNGACHGYILTGRNSSGGNEGWWNGVVLEMLNTETDSFTEE
jgi:hypothetical protein